jgi:hypothetical protein
MLVPEVLHHASTSLTGSSTYIRGGGKSRYLSKQRVRYELCPNFQRRHQSPLLTSPTFRSTCHMGVSIYESFNLNGKSATITTSWWLLSTRLPWMCMLWTWKVLQTQLHSCGDSALSGAAIYTSAYKAFSAKLSTVNTDSACLPLQFIFYIFWSYSKWLA